MYPHRIRLRGPWKYEPLDPPGPAGQMTMPCRWGDGGLTGYAGRVRFLRRFGYPGRLDDYERVWLTFAGVAGTADVALNGQFLGRHEEDDAPFEFEVTPLLRDRNELIVEVTSLNESGGLWGEVAMEIRCAAFLRNVRAWTARENEVQVRGEVVGTSERPLDLYVLLDGKTAYYTTVTAAPAGQPFQAVAEMAGAHPEVRVELVNGATVWYVVEVTQREA